jgi:hypothetical protein
MINSVIGVDSRISSSVRPLLTPCDATYCQGTGTGEPVLEELTAETHKWDI